MKIEIEPTGEKSASVKCGHYTVPVEWKDEKDKQQLIEMAKWTLREKLRDELKK